MNSRNFTLFFGLLVAVTFATGSVWGAFEPKHFLMGGFCVLAVWARDQFASGFDEKDPDLD
jgi:hypothetical protein